MFTLNVYYIWKSFGLVMKLVVLGLLSLMFLLTTTVVQAEVTAACEYLSVQSLNSLMRKPVNKSAAQSQIAQLNAELKTKQSSVLGKLDPSVASVNEQIADQYMLLANYKVAAGYYNQALLNRDPLMWIDQLGFARCLDKLSLAGLKSNKLEEAELALKHAYEIRRSHLKKDSTEIADTLEALANVYRLEGKDLAAVPIYQQVQAIWDGQGASLQALRKQSGGMAKYAKAKQELDRRKLNTMNLLAQTYDKLGQKEAAANLKIAAKNLAN